MIALAKEGSSLAQLKNAFLENVAVMESQNDLSPLIWSVVYFVYGNQISCGEKFKYLDRPRDLNS